MNQTVVHECNVEHVGRESVILKITEKAKQARCGGVRGEIRGQDSPTCHSWEEVGSWRGSKVEIRRCERESGKGQ